MNLLINLLGLFELVVNQLSVLSNTCTCSDLSSAHCNLNTDCTWANSQCTNSCSAFQDDPAACDQSDFCAYQNSTCDTFTSCSDYSTTVETECYMKSPTCIPGEYQNGLYQCATGFPNCSTITNSTVCKDKLVQSDGQVCWYDGSQCLAQNNSYCSTITSQSMCTSYICQWNSNGTCSQQMCSNLEGTANSCRFVYVNQTYVNVCFLTSDNTCIDASNITDLTYDYCYNSTDAGYTWINGECISCDELNNFSFMILINILFIILL